MATRVYTEAITAPVSISSSDSVSLLTIIVTTGTCTVNGSFPFQGKNSSVITLSAGQGITLPGAIGNPLDGITITPTGTTNMALQFN